MQRVLTVAAAVAILFFYGCSKDSDDAKDKIQHTVMVQFVDAHGNSIVNGQNHVGAVKIVWFDSEGEEHDFFNEHWFGMNGYTNDPFNNYIFTIYLTLPEDGNEVTRTYMRFFGGEPDVFETEYFVKIGNKEGEPYGGGTVALKTVKLNDVLIWDDSKKPDDYYKVFKELPEGE